MQGNQFTYNHHQIPDIYFNNWEHVLEKKSEWVCEMFDRMLHAGLVPLQQQFTISSGNDQVKRRFF